MGTEMNKDDLKKLYATAISQKQIIKKASTSDPKPGIIKCPVNITSNTKRVKADTVPNIIVNGNLTLSVINEIAKVVNNEGFDRFEALAKSTFTKVADELIPQYKYIEAADSITDCLKNYKKFLDYNYNEMTTKEAVSIEAINYLQSQLLDIRDGLINLDRKVNGRRA
jgi:hypothetical protein